MRPWSKKSYQWFCTNMSWNIQGLSKLIAVVCHFCTLRKQRKQEKRCFPLQNSSKTNNLSTENSIKENRLVNTKEKFFKMNQNLELILESLIYQSSCPRNKMNEREVEFCTNRIDHSIEALKWKIKIFLEKNKRLNIHNNHQHENNWKFRITERPKQKKERMIF